MNESNHTPGPWQVSGGRSRQDTYGHTIGPDGLGIACVFYSDRTNADHIASLADARLIAQAWKIPDLEAQIASLTAEVERLRAMPPVQWIQDQIAHQQRIYPSQDWNKIKSMSFDVSVIFRRWLEQTANTRAALQPNKEDK